MDAPMRQPPSFAQLFEQSPEPAYVIDPLDDRIVAANRAGCSLLGYAHDELLATPVSRIHPADLPQLRDFVEQVVRDGRASTIMLTCRTKLGTFLPTEMSLHAFLSDGQLRILGLVQDRSDHRQPTPEA
jgi:PAS domain S-box-containing protein